MRSIYRYELRITDRASVGMPAGAKVLPHPPSRWDVDGVEIWAEVDPDAPLEPREFRIVGTGHPIPDDCGRFVGTVWTHAGRYVWHIFEACDVMGGQL